jgi:hypothetical protein
MEFCRFPAEISWEAEHVKRVIICKGSYPEFPFCFPSDDSMPPIAAAAILFCIPSRAKEPEAAP